MFSFHPWSNLSRHILASSETPNSNVGCDRGRIPPSRPHMCTQLTKFHSQVWRHTLGIFTNTKHSGKDQGPLRTAAAFWAACLRYNRLLVNTGPEPMANGPRAREASPSAGLRMGQDCHRNVLSTLRQPLEANLYACWGSGSGDVISSGRPSLRA